MKNLPALRLEPAIFQFAHIFSFVTSHPYGSAITVRSCPCWYLTGRQYCEGPCSSGLKADKTKDRYFPPHVGPAGLLCSCFTHSPQLLWPGEPLQIFLSRCHHDYFDEQKSSNQKWKSTSRFGSSFDWVPSLQKMPSIRKSQIKLLAK